eukprot:TRINITY_DN3522_c0_g1_i1.p1 TRINITY_DN3522_c0_g1~~TRINITY_DN3522_c0_g1_i1.p1  ORF type:complete len:340 (+),score=47.95 TRINITY_DN3522_c0_g1_i1:786-1805(+)
MYKEMMEKQKQEEEAKKKEPSKEYFDQVDKLKNEPPPVYNSDGEIRQCNQGKYKFKFTDNWDEENLVLEVFVPKFLDTSLINVDLNPMYVRMDIKGKITQLKLSEEIIVGKSKVQRSTTTGALQLVCPKLNFDPAIKERKKKNKVQEKKEMKKEEVKKVQEPIKLAHILKKGEKEEELLKVCFTSLQIQLLQEISTISLKEEDAKPKAKVEEEDDKNKQIDDSEVPPLEQYYLQFIELIVINYQGSAVVCVVYLNGENCIRFSNQFLVSSIITQQRSYFTAYFLGDSQNAFPDIFLFFNVVSKVSISFKEMVLLKKSPFLFFWGSLFFYLVFSYSSSGT